MSDLTMKDSGEDVIWSGSGRGSVYMYDQRRGVYDPEGGIIDSKVKTKSSHFSDPTRGVLKALGQDEGM